MSLAFMVRNNRVLHIKYSNGRYGKGSPKVDACTFGEPFYSQCVGKRAKGVREYKKMGAGGL